MKSIKGKYATAKVFTNNAEEEALKQVEEMVNHELTKGTQVRLMPDIHKGKGSTIGTTIQLPKDFSEWKVSPNIVGVDVGCFTGTTEVMLADGRSLSFVELIEENNKGIENYIYGIDSNGEINIEKLYAPRKIDTVKELAYITLDNGETIECTTDHKFILRDGRSKEAKNLNVNDSLMPLYIEKAKNVKNEIRDYELSKLTKDMGEYHAIYMPGKNDYIMAHVLADNYNFKNDPSLEGKIYEDGKTSFIRHHIDFNKYNNNPTNIERVGFKQHWKIHADNLSKTNAMGLTGFARAIEIDPTLPSRAGKLRAEATWNGPNAEINYIEKSKLMRKMNENGLVNTKAQREASRKRQLENNSTKFSKQNSDPKFIKIQTKHRYARILQMCMKEYGMINEENWEKTRLKISNNSPKYSTFIKGLNQHSITLEELMKVELKKRNHKITNIEIKSVDETDVYCLTNFTHGNFALSAGVFVENCGIMMYKLRDKNVDLKKLDEIVNLVIPAGFTVHSEAQDNEYTENLLSNLTFKVGENKADRVHKSLGTLGGGNHFIELGKDENDNYWLSVHSGSRVLGVEVATRHQDIAIKKLEDNQLNIKSIIEELKSQGRHNEIQSTIAGIKENIVPLSNKDKTLATLEGEDLLNYIRDMELAQNFASKSREIMLNLIVEYMRFNVVEKFDSIHNFIEHNNLSNGIVRKGATSAKKGEELVIPLNMRDGSIIAVGKGNADWNDSAPHGAGRLMSRSKAKAEIRLEDFKNEMKEVYSSSIVESTLDEAPGAYKPAKEILEYIKPTVDVIHLVRPVYNFKAH